MSLSNKTLYLSRHNDIEDAVFKSCFDYLKSKFKTVEYYKKGKNYTTDKLKRADVFIVIPRMNDDGYNGVLGMGGRNELTLALSAGKPCLVWEVDEDEFYSTKSIVLEDLGCDDWTQVINIDFSEPDSLNNWCSYLSDSLMLKEKADRQLGKSIYATSKFPEETKVNGSDVDYPMTPDQCYTAKKKSQKLDTSLLLLRRRIK